MIALFEVGHLLRDSDSQGPQNVSVRVVLLAYKIFNSVCPFLASASVAIASQNDTCATYGSGSDLGFNQYDQNHGG